MVMAILLLDKMPDTNPINKPVCLPPKNSQRHQYNVALLRFCQLGVKMDRKRISEKCNISLTSIYCCVLVVIPVISDHIDSLCTASCNVRTFSGEDPIQQREQPKFQLCPPL